MKNSVMIRVRPETRDKLKRLSGDTTIPAYLNTLVCELTSGTQPRLESLKGEHTIGDLMMAIGELTLRIEELATKVHIIDVRSWQAFMGAQKNITQITAVIGLTNSAIEQKLIPGFKQMVEDQGKLLGEQMWKEVCLMNNWKEITTEEGPDDSSKN